MRTPNCSKCGGTMVEGYALTSNQHGKSVVSWTDGAPDRRWWGLKVRTKPVPVATWKCRRCGLLEFYAPV
jgi:predicted nucleic-acid-binding Zn-ribbon protein